VTPPQPRPGMASFGRNPPRVPDWLRSALPLDTLNWVRSVIVQRPATPPSARFPTGTARNRTDRIGGFVWSNSSARERGRIGFGRLKRSRSRIWVRFVSGVPPIGFDWPSRLSQDRTLRETWHSLRSQLSKKSPVSSPFSPLAFCESEDVPRRSVIEKQEMVGSATSTVAIQSPESRTSIEPTKPRFSR
jgi:hypothetical protein